MIFQKNSFQEILKDFIKNKFELMTSIFFYEQEGFTLFPINDLIQLHLY